MGQTRSPGPLPGHFTDLDGMRGVLAVTVMLFHLGLTRLIAGVTRGAIPLGLWGLCVDFFFILSGFVLYFAMSRSRPTIARYFIRRIRRLAPVFWIGTFLSLALSPLHWSSATIVANLLMVQSLARFGAIDFPAWSIPFELFLPALLLPVIGPLSRSRRSVTVALVLVAVAGAAWFALLLAQRHNIPLGRAGFGLALGMLLGRLRQQIAPGPARPRLVLALFGGALLCMMLGAKIAVLPAIFPLVSAACIFFGAQTRTVFSSAPLQALGRWSYPIYLLHIPVLQLVGITVGYPNALVTKALTIVATVVIGALVHRVVEAPLMRGRTMPVQTAP